MATLTPAPSALGLTSPALGPWFAPDITLPAPNADLSVTVSLNGGPKWLPPAAGLLSLHVATSPRPRDIATLRGASGGPAFADGATVAVFVLLAEVDARLASLMSSIPSAAGGVAAGAAVTRATVRTFALELPSTISDFNSLKGLLVPPANAPEDVGLVPSGSTKPP